MFWNARSCICSQIFFWASMSGASNQASRSSSILASTGQPNQPAAPLPRSGKLLPGLEVVSPAQVVQKLFQPPLSDGSLLARRVTSVPQSIDMYCELMPTDLNMACVTCAMICSCGCSDGDISSTFSPLYPLSATSLFPRATPPFPPLTPLPPHFATAVPASHNPPF